MRTISDKEIIKRIEIENPWWSEGSAIDDYFRSMRPRAYLESLYELITKKDVNRAVVLMGPRRVGKTVMLYHTVQRLIESGAPPQKILYVSIESPTYIGLSLERILKYYFDAHNIQQFKGCYVFFDEIQYLKGWEIHLKKLVDNFREIRFVVSGSAAAALKLKSIESGAGRFTNFLLPPLTFYEYLSLLNKDALITESEEISGFISYSYAAADIRKLNEEFVNYLNFGGYPEALFSEAIKADPQRYIRSDIIDKVLMRDLPSLYGIDDIQELNRLFTILAYNTGNEVSLDELSKGAGVAKNTIKKYLEYLEAAFLIKIFHRIDQAGKRFRRENYFKGYLTNPSMRCALFGPISSDDAFMGNMTETAIVSQWIHSPQFDRLYYSRWQGGEVDIVYMSVDGVDWCVECKWTNRFFERPEELKNLISFVLKNRKNECSVTTFDKNGVHIHNGVRIEYSESSVYCYTVGRNLTRRKGQAER
ncbi:MAG TPA: ATP-binding protein [Dissulfurispiraceae bacterium]